VEYVKLGNTGVEVSRICLGCMSLGNPDRGSHNWTLDGPAGRDLVRHAAERGINFFDTANVYSDGTSETALGAALKEFTNRDEIVLASKVHGRMRPGPNGAGLSRKAIFAELDHSLRRLDVDYLDLYQIHRFDPTTPIEETLEALNDAVRVGKVRYLGASSMSAWQFAKALFVSRAHGWAEFVTMQNHYNLLYREEEREMVPLCLDQKVAMLPWSPLARGRLTRDWDETTTRSANDEFGRNLYPNSDRSIVQAVARVAQARGVSRSQVALAWLLAQPGVVAPILGATKTEHLDEAISASKLHLHEDDVFTLESGYVPHDIAGH
jgi:aryl-alcohol dehydrogenase-like predicted oxidoreductase